MTLPKEAAISEAVTASIQDPDFLLGSTLARELYHGTAAACPIVDYHCHLDAGEMAANRRFENLARLWVSTDPYKHRAMRILGVPEASITGGADDRAKFLAWASCVPKLLGSPLYHWTALELDRYFGIDTPLNAETAEAIWEAANARLAEQGFRYRGLMERYPVETVCTSDRLLDPLDAHRRLAAEAGVGNWLPSLRSDDIIDVASERFPEWVAELAALPGDAPICDLDGFKAALTGRFDVFDGLGCRLADHGLDTVAYVRTKPDRAAELFGRRLAGPLTSAEEVELRSALLLWLGGEYARRGWVMQLHLGARRRTSPRLRRLAGPVGGFAAIGNPVDLDALCDWFGDLESEAGLPRVQLYPLNPSQFAACAALTGSFAEDGLPGKIRFGPAWWWNDHRAGMRHQLEQLAAYGVLSTFMGMTTDSRSVLSMVRHEYFRRVLCEWLGEQVATGAFPSDDGLLRDLVRLLCYENASRLFNPRS